MPSRSMSVVSVVSVVSVNMTDMQPVTLDTLIAY
jgi:hypothetical protein